MRSSCLHSERQESVENEDLWEASRALRAASLEVESLRGQLAVAGSFPRLRTTRTVRLSCSHATPGDSTDSICPSLPNPRPLAPTGQPATDPHSVGPCAFSTTSPAFAHRLPHLPTA